MKFANLQTAEEPLTWVENLETNIQSIEKYWKEHVHNA